MVVARGRGRRRRRGTGGSMLARTTAPQLGYSFLLLLMSLGLLQPSFSYHCTKPSNNQANSIRVCGLQADVTSDGQTISYYTTNSDGSERRDAIFKIIPNYLREIDMAERTVGTQGSAKIKHSVQQFSSQDYSWQAYPATSATSLYKSNETGWPEQKDPSLKVMRHTLFSGQIDGSTIVNKYQIDVFTFMNNGTWVDLTTKQQMTVYCGNIAIVQSIDNWNFCGRSTQAQAACESGAQGSALDLGIKLAGGNSWTSHNISGKQGLQYR